MKLLWNGDWIETPAPTPTPGAVLLRVEATIPIERVRSPSGRVIRAPYRKALRFAILDGPASTLRKTRSKREDARLQGDYRIVAALGRPHATANTGGPADDVDTVLALCPRAAPCAEFLLCHEDLVFAAPAASLEALERLANALRHDAESIAELATQSFLYSGQRPTARLREILAEAASGAVGSRSRESIGDGPETTQPERVAEPQLLQPPPSSGTPSFSTQIRLRDGGTGGLPVAVLGAGDYARTQIVPGLRRAGLRPYAIADREPQIAAEVGRASGFALATSDATEAIETLPGSGLVVVATAHDSHAKLAAIALEAGHRVFVEKPAVVTAEDLALLEAAVARAPGRLDVGFNRRYHPLTARLRSTIEEESGPLTITCLVREISISPNHWYFWPNQGTRVAGNLCHWIDLGISLLPFDARPVEVSVTPPAPDPADDASADAERVVSTTFDDGSVLSVVATDRGDDLRGVQETIDVRRGLMTARIDDFRSMTVLQNGRSRTIRRLWRTKGHERMFEAAFQRAASDRPAIYPVDDLGRVSRTQIVAAELIADGGSKRLPGGRNEPTRATTR